MEKKKFLIGTGNNGKFGEIMEVLRGLPYDFLRPADLGLDCDVEENGQTHEDNAYKKARHFFNQCGFLTLAEDSGIFVDALAGELGVKTRRWGAGEKATDLEWVEYFLDAMKDVPQDLRTARFVCCAALIDDKGEAHFFNGQTEGVITDGLQAQIKEGLPLSSCFKPAGFEKVYAALTSEEKNSISHRGKAIKAARDFLESCPGRLLT
jgi:XTP/dITP diphosphohydrolase